MNKIMLTDDEQQDLMNLLDCYATYTETKQVEQLGFPLQSNICNTTDTELTSFALGMSKKINDCKKQDYSTVAALQNFEKAYDDLRECWDGGNELLDSDISLETYPFAQSFDELGIYSWVNSVIEASNVDIK